MCEVAQTRLADHPNALSARLDDATMARLNAQVDVDRKGSKEVARDFLQEEGLVWTGPRRGPPRAPGTRSCNSGPISP